MALMCGCDEKEIEVLLSEQMLLGAWNDVDKCLVREMKIGDNRTCTRLIGSCNGSVAY